MFGYFSSGRFMSALRGADRELHQRTNRIPDAVKCFLVLATVFLIIKSEQSETIIRNTFIAVNALLGVDLVDGALSGGLYGFFTYRENEGQGRVNQILEENVPAPGL